MSDNLLYFLIFGFPLLVAITLYLFLQWRKSKKALTKMEEAKRAGLIDPVSLHPVINPSLCLGCGSCVAACPEGEILGLVKRKATLVSPSSCIGHGACKEACPSHAISLVFGSETRGVEIPLLSDEFESSVPGLFIAGELGGMGLIKNAIAQGQQAVTAIAKKIGKNNNNANDYDLIIVGAGPAGLSSALAAKEKKLKYLVLEQDSIGGSVAHYPRGKIAMTQPAVLPVVGKFQFREASKEKLVAFWVNVVAKAGLNIETGQRVEAIDKQEHGFLVSTQNKKIRCRSVLLAMGRRGTPRKLNVVGEELPKVVYRVIDPEQYQHQHVLVVGGGDSALEAALAISEQKGTRTTLSYRGNAFSRAKSKNRERVVEAEQQGRLRVLMESAVAKVSEKSVFLVHNEKEFEIANNSIIVCAGGVLPTPFLKKIGIHVEEKFGTI